MKNPKSGPGQSPLNGNGPMGEPGDTRNLFFAIVLSLAVILGWQHFVDKPQQDAQNAAQQQVLDSTSATGAPVAPAGNDTAPEVVRDRATVLADTPRRAIKAPSIEGSISLKGGRIDDVHLVKYRETMEANSPEITLMSPAGVAQPYYTEFGWRAEAGVVVPDQNTLWHAASTEALAPGKPLTLSWSNGAGLTFEKKIAVDENYMFTITQSVKNETGRPVTLHPYGLVARAAEPDAGSSFLPHEGVVGVYDGQLHEDNYKSLNQQTAAVRTTTGGWFGFTDKYWLVALVPPQDGEVTVRALHVPQIAADRYQADYMAAPVTVAPGATGSVESRLFAGAKEVRLLDHYKNDLQITHFDLAVDFGWFYFLTKPFFYAITALAGVLGNLGLAIMAFTVLVKLLLFPLADHAYFSMAKMKQMMPKLQEIRETYASDQQKQSQEMMALYKKEGIHPLSGCWPILIQIPIFFALYKVLYVAIEMRHAPFYGWVHDLSAADPSNLFSLFGLLPGPILGVHIGALPLLMGLTMWLQMKMNPPPTDPAQRVVFGMMPIIFTISMAGFPVGLVIYWTWSNLLSILQQYVLMRRMKVRAF